MLHPLSLYEPPEKWAIAVIVVKVAIAKGSGIGRLVGFSV